MGDYTGCELDIPLGLAEETLERIAAAFIERTGADFDVLEALRGSGHATGADFRVGDEQNFADELRKIAEFPFTFWSSPKYDYLGQLVKYTPRLQGYFIADCTDSGDIVVSNANLLDCVRRATSAAEVKAWVEKELGCAWDNPTGPASDPTTPAQIHP